MQHEISLYETNKYKSVMTINKRYMCQFILLWAVMEKNAILNGLSTQGKHFITGIPQNRILAEYPVVRFYITTFSTDIVTGEIIIPYLDTEIADVQHRYFMVKAGGVVIEQYDVHINNVQAEGTSIENKGIIIEASAEITVQIGAINDFSSDAFLAIPTPALSTEYYTLTYLYKKSPELGTNQGPTQILIIATEDETTVTIEFPLHFTHEAMQTIIRDLSITSYDLHTRTLVVPGLLLCNTLQIQSNIDLSGTKIVANLPIAVIAGTVWSSVLVEKMGDHLVEQMPPTNTWGGEFVASTVVNRTSGDIFRVLARLNDTKVFVFGDSGKQTIYLDAGVYDDFLVDSGEVIHIRSNKPILVMQLCTSYFADAGKFGDPFMALVTPVEQFSKAISFSTLSSLFDDYANFLTIVTDAQNVDDVLLDGQLIPIENIVEPWQNIPNTNFSILTIDLPDPPGFHALTSISTNVKFGGILYGFEIQESYGLPLGQNLDPIEVVCTSGVHEWADFLDNDCDGRIDEEIANGIDDDNDGLIDEDIFNNKESRIQSIDFSRSERPNSESNDLGTSGFLEGDYFTSTSSFLSTSTDSQSETTVSISGWATTVNVDLETTSVVEITENNFSIANSQSASVETKSVTPSGKGTTKWYSGTAHFNRTESMTSVSTQLKVSTKSSIDFDTTRGSYDVHETTTQSVLDSIWTSTDPTFNFGDVTTQKRFQKTDFKNDTSLPTTEQGINSVLKTTSKTSTEAPVNFEVLSTGDFDSTVISTTKSSKIFFTTRFRERAYHTTALETSSRKIHSYSTQSYNSLLKYFTSVKSTAFTNKLQTSESAIQNSGSILEITTETIKISTEKKRNSQSQSVVNDVSTEDITTIRSEQFTTAFDKSTHDVNGLTSLTTKDNFNKISTSASFHIERTEETTNYTISDNFNFTTPVVTTPSRHKGSQNKIDLWEQQIKMIIIAVCILLGLPILICFCLCTRTLLSSYYTKNANKQNKCKDTSKSHLDLLVNKTKHKRLEETRKVFHDCRHKSSVCSY